MNEYPRDSAMWMEAYNAKYDRMGKFEKKEWDQLLGHYSDSSYSENDQAGPQAVCDLPAIAFGPELMNAYPSAKVILTNRDEDQWYNSCSQTLLRARWYWAHEVLQYIDWVTALVHPLRKKYWQCLFADDFQSNGKAAMRAHYQEIRHLAQQKRRKVLELDLGDGWEPLCNFLEVDIPSVPYPRINDGVNWTSKMKARARLRARAAIATIMAWIAVPIIVACLGAGVLAATQRNGNLSIRVDK
ncbi:MAG: hypothetical protein Q9167_001827 [Letrouitia subvulpina]